jgi:hypothetical protein
LDSPSGSRQILGPPAPRDAKIAGDVSGITKTELTDLLAVEEAWMRPGDLAFWKVVQIEPVLWASPEHGDFWVVAVWGNMYIWFNHIEEGFNIAPYKVFGRIERMSYGQSKLHERFEGQENRLIRSIRDPE